MSSPQGTTKYFVIVQLRSGYWKHDIYLVDHVKCCVSCCVRLLGRCRIIVPVSIEPESEREEGVPDLGSSEMGTFIDL